MASPGALIAEEAAAPADYMHVLTSLPGEVAERQQSDAREPKLSSRYKLLFASSALLLALGLVCAFAPWPRMLRYTPEPVQGGSLAALQLDAMDSQEIPAWIMDLVDQAGGRNASKRGFRLHDDTQGKIMARVFGASHVEGFAPGTPHGQLFIWLHSRDVLGQSGKEAEIGPVVLSDNAKLLRRAMQQRGFEYKTLYHGTKNQFVPSIISGGFLFAQTARKGQGIYFCETHDHAECYSSGDGGPVLEVEVFYDPKNESRYLGHVLHESEANDVFVVHDPIIIFPVEVHKCCQGPLNCI